MDSGSPHLEDFTAPPPYSATDVLPPDSASYHHPLHPDFRAHRFDVELRASERRADDLDKDKTFIAFAAIEAGTRRRLELDGDINEVKALKKQFAAHPELASYIPKIEERIKE